MKLRVSLAAALLVLTPVAALAQQTVDYAASRARIPAAATAYAAGLQKYGAKDFAGALQDFGRAAAADPTDAESLFNVAVISNEASQFQQALEAFQRVLNVPEKRLSDDLWTGARAGVLSVGTHYMQVADYAAAASTFRSMTQSPPKDRVVLFNLALSLYRQEKWAELDSVASQLTALDPLNENALVMLSQARRSQAGLLDKDSAAGKAMAAKAISAMEAVADAPFFLDVLQAGEKDAGFEVKAEARWNHPKRSEKTLHFTFYGRRGAVGTSRIIVGVPKTGNVEPFTLKPVVKGKVASFSYRVE